MFHMVLSSYYFNISQEYLFWCDRSLNYCYSLYGYNSSEITKYDRHDVFTMMCLLYWEIEPAYNWFLWWERSSNVPPLARPTHFIFLKYWSKMCSYHHNRIFISILDGVWSKCNFIWNEQILMQFVCSMKINVMIYRYTAAKWSN